MFQILVVESYVIVYCMEKYSWLPNYYECLRMHTQWNNQLYMYHFIDHENRDWLVIGDFTDNCKVKLLYLMLITQPNDSSRMQCAAYESSSFDFHVRISSKTPNV